MIGDVPPWQQVPPEIKQLQARLTALQHENNAYSQRYSGLMQMFSSAAQLNDGKAMDEYRAQAHVCLDQMLDTNVTIYMVTRQLTAAIGQ